MFEWPLKSMTANKALNVALSHMPKGCFVSIANALPIPEYLKNEDGTLLDSVIEAYHGTERDSMVGITSSGFYANLGAGAEALSRHHGFPVPGVYISKNLKVAAYYKNSPRTTKPIPELPGPPVHSYWSRVYDD